MKGSDNMKKFTLVLLLASISCLLMACGVEKESVNQKEDVVVSVDSNVGDKKDVQESDAKAGENLTLPSGFPSDFPFPDNIKITNIEDASDEDRKSYSIKFDFDSDLDLEATFEMYNDYTKKIGYDVLIGGEEYFAEGIFQFGANKPMSVDDMFVVTIKIEDGKYGSIDLKTTE
ncbi:MAG TPA: hypothetical protein GX525_01230 [Bacilli bacterium]|nr:hypothetical protein [Bacilli bacterium]